MYRGRSLAAVVPAYNEEMLIGITLESIPEYVDMVIVVNDGSTDSTESKIREIMESDPRIELINKENGGVGSAIVEGYKAGLIKGADISVVMAGDNQMDPECLPSLLDPIVEGEADYTKGNRLTDGKAIKGMSAWRYFGNSLLTGMTKLSSGLWHIGDPQNGYTAIDNRVFEVLDPDEIFPWYGYCNDILTRLNMYGFRVKDVRIPSRYGDEVSTIKYPEYMYKLSRLLLIQLMMRITYRQREKGVLTFVSVCLLSMFACYIGILLALDYRVWSYVPIEFVLFVLYGAFLIVLVLFSFYMLLLVLGTLFLDFRAPKIEM